MNPDASGPRPSPPPPQPPRPPGPGRLGVVIVAALVLGMSLILTPAAVPVWTAAYIPAANRVHYGDALIVLMVLAGFGLYTAVSLLQPRRTYSPAGSPTLGLPGLSRPGTTTAAAVPRGAAADGTHTRAARNARPAFPASRPVEEEAAGRDVTP